MIMENNNQVILSGTIGRVDTKTVGDNKKLTQLGIAIGETAVKNETTGKDETTAIWENVDCWGRVSAVAQSYKKGDIVLVTGTRRIDSYTNQKGETKENSKVLASFVLKLGAETPRTNSSEIKKATEPKPTEPIDESLPF